MKNLSTFSIWIVLIVVAILAAPFSMALAEPAPLAADVGAPLMALGGLISLRGYFTAQAIVQYLKNLPVIKTPVIDTVFKNRPQLGLPIVGRDEVNHVVRAMALRQRGAGSIPIPGTTGGTDFFEPLPINPDVFVGAHELNNLKLLGESSRQKWAQAKTDLLRRTIRATTEAIAAQSITGSVAWPVQLEGGTYDNYVIEFGAPVAFVPDKLWDAADASIKDMFESLEGMQEKLQENGYGSEIEIWAGKTSYSEALAATLNYQGKAKVKVEVSEGGINIGGFIIKRRTEKNRNPETGVMTPVVADKDVVMIALDANHVMPYTALDDLDANLQPLPMFVKPIEKKNPSGVQLVGMSKPFASPNMKGICKATVTA